MSREDTPRFDRRQAVGPMSWAPSSASALAVPVCGSVRSARHEPGDRDVLRRGDYELIELLGKGGMAQVWRARHDGPGGATKGVAVKLIHAHLARDPVYREMFVREARLAMQLNSPNIVQVFGAGEDGDELFLVMEWVQGHNLSTIIRMLWARGETIPLELSAFVVGEILSALDHAHHIYCEGHATGIIHRDVTPQNVLVSKDGAVKLADFGVARAADDRSGTGAKGKLRYMAREHLLGNPTQRSDLFGVGAIFHELVAGQRFRPEALDDPQLYHAIMSGDAWRPSFGLPEPLSRLLDGLLAPEEAQRIPSASAALELLESWPGYRHGRSGLKRLYESLLGPQSSRTGFTRILGPEEAEALRAAEPPAPTRVEAEASPAPATRTVALQGEGAGASASAPRRRTLALDPEEPSPSTATPVQPPAFIAEAPTNTAAAHPGELAEPTGFAVPAALHPTGARRRWLWIPLATVAVALVAFGVGMLLVGSPLASTPNPIASVEPAADEQVDPIAPPAPRPAIPGGSAAGELRPVAAVGTAKVHDPTPTEAAPAKDDGPIGDNDAPQGADGRARDGGSTRRTRREPAAGGTPSPSKPAPPQTPSPEPSPGLAEEPSTEPSPGPAKKPSPEPSSDPPKLVHLRLSGVDAAYVRIDGKTHVVDPHGSTRLVAGRHRMSWRTTKNEPWARNKTFTIDAGVDEWVVVVSPTGLRVESLRDFLQKGGR